MSKPDKSVNYGIIGNVSAKAVGVGDGAKAVVNENAAVSRVEFDAALAAIRDQIAALPLAQSSREVLNAEVSRMEQMAGEKPEHKTAAIDLLKSFVDKLKIVGVLLDSAAALQGPLRKIAGWFGVPLPF